MKSLKLFILITALMNSYGIYADTIECESVDADDYTTFVYDSSAAICNGSNEKYLVLIDGIGIGYRDNTSNFSISCPYQQKLDGTYIGVKSDISVGKGLVGGLYIGKGACVIAGIQEGGGAAISGSKMEIINYDRIYGGHGGIKIRDID